MGTSNRRAGAGPTLVQVAERAGVSLMTASRALAGQQVRQQNLQRVLAAANELGYRRNESARALRPGQSSGLIGVVITNITNPYYAEFVLGVEDVAAQAGKRLLLGVSAERPERQRAVISDFLGWRVDGLVVVPAGGPDDVSADRLAEVPVVLASRAVRGLRADSVLLDDVEGARRGTERLLARGHRRIAFLGTSSSTFTARRRLEGFRAAHAEAGVEVAEELIAGGQHDSDAAARSARRLLALDDPPQAWFAANNRNTVGLLRSLAEVRRADPDDPRVADSTAIAAFDAFDLAELVPWPLIVIDHDARELGRVAAQLLLARLAEPGAAVKSVQLSVRVREATEPT